MHYKATSPIAPEKPLLLAVEEGAANPSSRQVNKGNAGLDDIDAATKGERCCRNIEFSESARDP